MAEQSPIPGLKVAGPKDLKDRLPMEVAMDFRWKGWMNERVLAAVRGKSRKRLTHMRFVPDPEKGLVYMMQAEKDDYGAIKLDYSAPETGAEISLYLPLLDFELEREEGRLRIFTVESHEPVNGQVYMALNVTDSKSVPSTRRSSGAQQPAPGPETPGAGTPGPETPGAGTPVAGTPGVQPERPTGAPVTQAAAGEGATPSPAPAGEDGTKSQA